MIPACSSYTSRFLPDFTLNGSHIMRKTSTEIGRKGEEKSVKRQHNFFETFVDRARSVYTRVYANTYIKLYVRLFILKKK